MRTIFLIILSLFANSNLYASTEMIEKAVDNKNRKIENVLRDQYRNPMSTLSFFEINESMNVLEILPGKGYYTEILANLLKDKGKLTVASFGDDFPIKPLQKMHLEFKNYFIKNKQSFGDIEIIDFRNKNYLDKIKDDSIDLVVTFRNSHNWIKMGSAKKIYKSINRVLKKNGILGVVQHKADKSADESDSLKNGYVQEKSLINLIENQGFKFISKSSVNRNFKDTKDHPKGVWTLPPTLRLKDVDKEKYLAIGESDRMTLKFLKD